MKQIRNPKKKKAFKEVSFREEYPDFKSFYDTNKEEIYRNIIEVFRGFTSSRRKILELHVSATIDGFEWKTDFNFHRYDLQPLKKDIMPFFEDIEDYEACSDIINIHKQLTSKK